MKTLMKGLIFVAVLLVLAVGTTQATIDLSSVQKLVAGDGTAGELFGYSIAVSGDTAIIGAWGDDSGKGAAYVFRQAADGTWKQQDKLIAADSAYWDAFGVAVALSADGRTAVIGAAGNVSADSYRPGLAYVFIYSGNSWTQQAKLTDPEGTDGDAFGGTAALSSDGNTALIGASIAFFAGNNGKAGAAYIFTRSGNNWTQQAKLISSDGGGGFGYAVALSADGGIALIGASGQSSAYIFSRYSSSWTQQAELTTNNYGGDGFGTSVSLSANGSIALIGANGDDGAKGAAYISPVLAASGRSRLN